MLNLLKAYIQKYSFLRMGMLAGAIGLHAIVPSGQNVTLFLMFHVWLMSFMLLCLGLVTRDLLPGLASTQYTRSPQAARPYLVPLPSEDERLYKVFLVGSACVCVLNYVFVAMSSGKVYFFSILALVVFRRLRSNQNLAQNSIPYWLFDFCFLLLLGAALALTMRPYEIWDVKELFPALTLAGAGLSLAFLGLGFFDFLPEVNGQPDSRVGTYYFIGANLLSIIGYVIALSLGEGRWVYYALFVHLAYGIYGILRVQKRLTDKHIPLEFWLWVILFLPLLKKIL